MSHDETDIQDTHFYNSESHSSNQNSTAVNVKRNPPDNVIARLPKYYRVLKSLISSDVMRISSRGLAEVIGASASQIRSDLSYFGEFGQQGYGYNVRLLFTGISSVLGVTDEFRAVILGSGASAQAAAENSIFQRRGIILKGSFSIHDSERIKDMPTREIVSQIDNFLIENPAEILVLCDFCGTDQYILAKLCERHNILGIWNLTESELDENIFKGIQIKTVYLSDSLMTLCHSIKQKMTEISDRDSSKEELSEQN